MLLRWTSNQPSYDPWREFRALQRQMDTVFRDLVPTRRTSGRSPAFNVSDLGDKYRIEAELPGVRHDDLKIDATVNSVTIKGKRDVSPPEGYASHRNERSTLEFSRAFTFDSKLDLEKVSATLDRGMLRLELTKQALEQPRSITVKAG